jgi:SAM-dependent methyltransferase
MNAEGRKIADDLRQQISIDDARFDQLFPSELRDLSALHWTPVEIAMRAAQLLASSENARILDVGSGIGKACLVGTLSSTSSWWGVERDPDLVSAANRAAKFLGVEDRARFIQGDAWQLDWNQFDGFYFYNPFSSLLLNEHTSPFVRYGIILHNVRRAEERLAKARTGTLVVTYHGFGGDMPAGYEIVLREPAGSDELILWIRRPAATSCFD